MIITQTPFRISFIGGGSDIPQFYRHSPGATISTAINKYVYVCLSKNFYENLIRLSYSKTEIVEDLNKLEHTRVRACLEKFGIKNGIEIVTIADIPSKGTGLGSSSSFTVGLLNALYAYKGETAGKELIANDACKVEIETLKQPIGKQDQYIASFGGFKFIEYLSNDKIVVNDILCKQETLFHIQESILLFFTGITRSSDSILKNQIIGYKKVDKFKEMQKMVKLAHELRKDIENNNLNSFGNILHEGWLIKKTLADGISNPEIDEMYNIARMNGALGGKLLGAGGGGFLLVYASPKNHEAIRQGLNKYKEVKISFEPDGTKIFFKNINE